MSTNFRFYFYFYIFSFLSPIVFTSTVSCLLDEILTGERADRQQVKKQLTKSKLMANTSTNSSREMLNQKIICSIRLFESAVFFSSFLDALDCATDYVSCWCVCVCVEADFIAFHFHVDAICVKLEISFLFVFFLIFFMQCKSISILILYGLFPKRRRMYRFSIKMKPWQRTLTK